MELIKRLYYWFCYDIMGREELYTDTWRRWIKAHPKLARLIIGGSIAGFASWIAFILHVFELW